MTKFLCITFYILAGIVAIVASLSLIGAAKSDYIPLSAAIGASAPVFGAALALLWAGAVVGTLGDILATLRGENAGGAQLAAGDGSRYSEVVDRLG